jgi:hypothetical protein
MPSSGILRRVALVKTDVSEELIASIMKMRRIGELGTTSAVTINRSTLLRNTAQCRIFTEAWVWVSELDDVLLRFFRL